MLLCIIYFDKLKIGNEKIKPLSNRNQRSNNNITLINQCIQTTYLKLKTKPDKTRISPIHIHKDSNFIT